jgi:hypothetical protein
MDSWRFSFLSVYPNLGVVQKVKSVILTSPTYPASVAHAVTPGPGMDHLNLPHFLQTVINQWSDSAKAEKKKNVSRVYPGYWGEKQTVVVVIVAIVTG